MYVQEAIMSAMRKLTVYASGETPTPSELADGLSALQSMLRTWAARRILVSSSTKESFTLIPGQYLYTWGVSGDIITGRPSQLLGASIVDSEGVTHIVDIISEGKYRGISVKGTVGRPYALFFQPSFPLASIYIYPVPSDAESILFDSLKPFTETSSFTDLADVLSFPPHYEEAIIYNLAIRLADEFGKKVSISVAAIASATIESIIAGNSVNQAEEVAIIMPAGSASGARYSINSDSYH